MLAEQEKDTLCINQIIGQKNYSTVIEEDFVVPDIKPDILNAIDTSGTVCIYKKEVMNENVKIEGSINTYIIYLADNEQNSVRSINVNLDFTQQIEFERLKIGMKVETKSSIKQIECRVLNGRKINIRAILEIELKGYSNENFEFLNSVQNIENIQVLNKEININSLLGTGNTKVYAKDTIMLPNSDELAEIMKVRTDIKNKEIKISYNKILIKADNVCKIMYLTTDNRICTKEAVIPVMGFIDMQDINDENICNVQYEIRNILIKPNNVEEHSIYVEFEIEVNCLTYNTRNLNLIQDLYSTNEDVTYKQNIIRTISNKKVTNDMLQIRDKQNIEELQGGQIYDIDIKPCILEQKILEDKIMYEGELELDCVFSSNNELNLKSKKIIIPFNYNYNFNGVDNNTKINTEIEVLSQDFIILPDGSLDIKIDLQFIIDSFENREINVINEVNVEENRDIQRDSMIIYFTKPGDTLWKIAKKFKSTVGSIVKLNNIENENLIDVGKQLFIPIWDIS